MTAHKHFKHIIRERMKKTGERYAAARRNLLQDQGALPDDPAAQFHRPGQIAAANALQILLSAAGIPNPLDPGGWSEADVFGVAGGVGIGVAAFVYEKEDFASFYVAGRYSWHDHLAYFNGALNALGVSAEVRETGSVKAAEANLIEALASGRPCIAWVDAPSLPHRGMPAWMRGGGYHVVTVYRMDPDARMALIGDASDAPIEIPLATLTEARGRIKKDKYRLLWIESTKSKPIVANDLVRDALRRCAEGLVSRPIKSAGDMFHLDGLRKWAERMHGSDTKESWSRAFKPGSRLWQGLTSIFEFVEHYGTGGGLCRPIFATYLASAAGHLDKTSMKGGALSAGLSELSVEYATIGKEWTALAEAALPERVPMFREAKDLLTRKSELWADAGPEAAEEILSVWARLDELKLEAKAAFPISDADCDRLRGELRGHIERIHAREVTAQEAMRALSKTT